jgi:biopolymer transport protein ExbD
MSNSRYSKLKRKRGKNKLFELELTSLMDVLVIILFFLIKSYSSDSSKVVLPKNIRVPDSISQSTTEDAVIVQMDTEKNIWMDTQLVTSLTKKNEKANFDEKHVGKDRIIPLFEALVAKRESINNLHLQATDAAAFSGKINLIMDRSLPYQYIKRIMYTATEAGYKEFKFIVMGDS